MFLGLNCKGTGKGAAVLSLKMRLYSRCWYTCRAKTACAPGSTSLSESVYHNRKARFHKKIKQFSTSFFDCRNENLFTWIIFTSSRPGSIYVTVSLLEIKNSVNCFQGKQTKFQERQKKNILCSFLQLFT